MRSFLVLLTSLVAPAALNSQTFTVLHTFNGRTDGAHPYGGLVLDAKGNIYGTTQEGGTACCGTVFRIDPAGQKTVVHNFSGSPNDGTDPIAALIADGTGNFYGTTLLGGAYNSGTVFALGRTGSEKILFSPQNGMTEGALVRDPQGNLYGTTQNTVFKLDATGQVTLLHTFTGTPDGSNCQAGLLRDADGNLFGTTTNGGIFDKGTVFEINAAGQESVLYSFSGGVDGGYPVTWLIEDSQGNLYGTTSGGGAIGSGTVFKLGKNNSETVLYSFTGFADGNGPVAGLTADGQGHLYGTTVGGGAYSAGAVFKLDASGNETVLYSFTGQSDGGELWSGVVLDKTGNLYGTAWTGGNRQHTGCKFGCGVVYKITP